MQRSNIKQISGIKPIEYYVVGIFYPRYFNERSRTWHPAQVQAIVDLDKSVNDAFQTVRDAISDGLKVEYVHHIVMGQAPEDLTDEMVREAQDAITLQAAE
jgi:hypothetical protein